MTLPSSSGLALLYLSLVRNNNYFISSSRRYLIQKAASASRVLGALVLNVASVGASD